MTLAAKQARFAWLRFSTFWSRIGARPDSRREKRMISLRPRTLARRRLTRWSDLIEALAINTHPGRTPFRQYVGDVEQPTRNFRLLAAVDRVELSSMSSVDRRRLEDFGAIA